MPENNQNECGQIMESYDSKSGGITSSRPPVRKKPEISTAIMELDAEEIESQKRLEEERRKRQAEEECAEAHRKKQAEKEAKERRQREEEQKKISDEWKRIEEAQAKLKKEKKRIKSEQNALFREQRRIREDRERQEREEREKREQQEQQEREERERQQKRERLYYLTCEELDQYVSCGQLEAKAIELFVKNGNLFRDKAKRFAVLGNYKDSALQQKICTETADAIERYYEDGQKGRAIRMILFAILLIAALVVFHLFVPLPVGWTKYLLFAGEVIVMSVLFAGLLVKDVADIWDSAAFALSTPLIYPLFYTFYLFPSAAADAGMGRFGVIISSLVPTLIGYAVGFVTVVLLTRVLEEYFDDIKVKRRIYKKIRRKYIK